MSDPKRYEPSSHRSADNGMAEQQGGKWVRYEDYASAKDCLHQVLAEAIHEGTRRLTIIRKLISEGENLQGIIHGEYPEATAKDMTKGWDALLEELRVTKGGRK